ERDHFEVSIREVLRDDFPNIFRHHPLPGSLRDRLVEVLTEVAGAFGVGDIQEFRTFVADEQILRLANVVEAERNAKLATPVPSPHPELDATGEVRWVTDLLYRDVEDGSVVVARRIDALAPDDWRVVEANQQLEQAVKEAEDAVEAIVGV